MAITFVLLIATGLLVRSLVSLVGVQLGFAPERVALLQVHVWSAYHEPAARAAFFARALERLAAAPGVEAAGAAVAVPMFDGRIERPIRFAIEGRVRGAAEELPSAIQDSVTPGTFDALRIPLVEGRVFTAGDTAESLPVAIVNRALARRFWPDESPVGKRISHEDHGESVTREVVGVVGAVRQEGLQSDPQPEVYLPHAQDPYGSMTFVVRGAYDPFALLRSAQQEIWAIHPDLVFAQTTTLERVVSDSLKERRFRLMLFGCFAAVALVLVLIGVYGLVSFSASQRRFEIGLRMALGASASSILRLVVKQEVATILLGIGLGSLLALVFTRFLESWLFGISPHDPATFVAIGALLAVVALLACSVPAHRATRVPPTVALRQG